MVKFGKCKLHKQTNIFISRMWVATSYAVISYEKREKFGAKQEGFKYENKEQRKCKMQKTTEKQ